MKALTLHQPNATLHAIAAKRLDPRDWSTEHRGPVAIHASKSFPASAKDRCFEEPYCTVLHAAGIKRLSELPLGSIVSVSLLRAVYTVDQAKVILASSCSPNEERFGKFDAYNFALAFDLIERLKKPIPIGGDSGLWDLPRDLSALLMTRVATWQQMHSSVSQGGSQ